MNSDISFTLKAYTAQFTKGVAAASNSVKDFKHSLREGDVGNGIKQLFGAGAIIAGMRAVINNAQEMRKSFEEMGKPISENIRSLAEFGDAIDSYKKTAMEAGTATVGFFTRTGEKIGNWAISVTNAFRAMKGKAAIETDEKGDRAAAALEAELAKKQKDFAQRNSHDELAKKEKEVADARRKYADEGANAEQKRVNLMRDLNALMAQRAQLEAAPQRDQSKILENKKAQIEKTIEINRANDAAEALEGKKHDKYRDTLVQLANGQITEGMDQGKRGAILNARKVLQLESQADAQGFAGKLDLSDASMSQANKLRQGLAGFVKSDEVDKDKDFAAAVDKLNDTLNNKALVVTKIY